MVKNLPYRYREIVLVQRYISFTGVYHWYGKKMCNPTRSARGSPNILLQQLRLIFLLYVVAEERFLPRARAQ